MKEMKDWTFITNHGLVLLYISQNPRCTARTMALAINITERTVHRILDGLETEGYIKRERIGKSNLYQMNTDLGLRHNLTRDVVVGDLIEVLGRR